MTDDPKRNPGWKRPADWPYEEDWDSPAWRERMRKRMAEIAEQREREGFIDCPRCKTQHTGKTLVCRVCGFRASEKEK